MREVGDSRTDGVCRPSEAMATTSVRDHVLSARVAYTIFPHDVREVRFPTRRVEINIFDTLQKYFTSGKDTFQKNFLYYCVERSCKVFTTI